MSSKVLYKTEWKAERKIKGLSDKGVGREQSDGNKKCTGDAMSMWSISVMELSVTGSGSTGVCCPSARQWLGGHLCPLRCCPVTHRVQTCPLSASATQCGRFLQREKKKQ